MTIARTASMSGRFTALALGLALYLVLAGCGSAEATPAAAPAPTSPPAVEPEPTPAPAEPVVAATAPASTPAPTGPELAEPALIEVEWRPAFNRDIVLELASGFFISEDGYALVGNATITGNETLSVLLPGVEQPVSARFVAADECLNLAVIQVSGTGHPFLELSPRPLEDGDTVYSPQYVDTLLNYMFKPRRVTGVELDGAAVAVDAERLISHTADRFPYSGPILDAEGNVVGVRTGSLQTGVNQFEGLMIPIGDVLEAIERLRRGETAAWVGIDSAAVAGDQTGLPGMYVAGVHPGSPAAELGLDLTDQILEMDGVTLGQDGTKSVYCDILRGLDPNTPIPVVVMRARKDQILEGELFGAPLTVVGTVTDYRAANPR
jgi:serine protease Do